MSTYMVLRELDPTLTVNEREAAAVRTIVTLGLFPGVHWLRSYVIDRPERYGSFCLYEGPSAEEVAYRSAYCRVPFREVRPVSEVLPESFGLDAQPEADGPLFVIRREMAKGMTDAGVEAMRFRSAGGRDGFPGVRWERSYWDADRATSYCVYRAPSPDALREHATLARIPATSIDEVVEAHPSQWAEIYEEYGVEKYWTDAAPVGT